MFNRPWPPLMHILVLINRLALGGYLLLMGWQKVASELEMGVGTYLSSAAFQSQVPEGLPQEVVQAWGYGAPWVELVLGGLLMAGLCGRTVAAGVTGVLALTGLAMVLSQPLAPQPMVVMLSLGLTLAVLGPGRYSLDAMLMGWRRLNQKMDSATGVTKPA